MDYGFRFPLRSIVRLHGTDPSVYGSCRWLVVSRALMEDEGGVTRSYRCRALHRDGNTVTALFAFNECELDPSEPFAAV